ncbi:hypothetical protein RDI58_003907 [Solanum bulbocastanum]|uniref:Uncharacterized protein n=1 Tax=Solanum bulbocastanum TaxID=147425 RepID=A0AAN8U4T1_SOLBU
MKYDGFSPKKLVKLVRRPKIMREREKNEVVKRQGVWKQTRKGKVMTCSNCQEQNHNARGCEKAKQGKQPTKKQRKQPFKKGKETVAEDDDEDHRLRPRKISEEAFLIRLRNRQNPQKPIGSRVIGFRGDKYGVSEPTNLPIAPPGLTWNG